ncbi:NlpC/P60 family protein [uncultured Gulosibacter sp.]|uniref:NlpC/P60 family protein n=1 Tax=uncultured Gulosibacter sp. TaxID=1339167 RepID=UPI0028890BF7|nr:NlpC/P60 family protein [uncultured Gulosibacter sp.]
MDNVTSITDAPLTRRQAREIERRTGIRPIAGDAGQSVTTKGEAFRHDTGEIKRNDAAALVSVLPTELIAAVSEVHAPEAELAEVAETVDSERSLTVRATVPAVLVAQRRRRTIGGFAAAASVAAAATVGMGSLTATADDQNATDKHLASLAAAVNGGGSQLPEQAEKNEVIAAAAPVTITAENTSVTAISAEALASTAEATEVVVAEPVESVETVSDETSTEAAPAAPQRTAPVGSGSAALAAAAYNQVGITQDCTDAVQNALAEIGLTTRRDQGGYDMGVSSFAQFGTPVSPDQAQPGDIMISYGYHVAIYLGDNTAMHGGWNGDADDTVVTTQMGSPYDFDVIIRLP